jgi:hypothetical protein
MLDWQEILICMTFCAPTCFGFCELLHWIIRKVKEHPHCMFCGACMKKKGEVCEACVKDLMKGGPTLQRFN